MSCVSTSLSQVYRSCRSPLRWLYQTQPEGEKGAKVLAQSAHHLLSGTGGGFTLSIPHCVFITQHTNTDHWGVSAHSAQLMQHPLPPSLFLKAEWAVAWLERWLHTRATLNKPNTCFLSGCTCSVGPQGSAVCLPCCCCVDWVIPH